MSKQTRNIFLAAIFPVLILLGMTVKPLLTITTGQEIILETKPVDPTDLFRGDYVTLSYKIEEIEAKLLDKKVVEKHSEKGYNLPVYVLLKEANGVYSPVSVMIEKPAEGIYLKGTLRYIDSHFNTGNKTAFIDYSLDRYFLEENTGLPWEEMARNGNIIAKVKVRNGYAILTGIEKNES